MLLFRKDVAANQEIFFFTYYFPEKNGTLYINKEKGGKKMFKVGDFVVYGHNGVCEVKKIGTLDSASADRERMYYTLVPYNDREGRVFAPVDNRKIPMRDIMTEQEALELIEKMKEISELQIPEERKREEKYKEAIKTCDGEELVRIIKTIYRRKRYREAQGKRMTAADHRYFKAAESTLYNELSVSLGIPAGKVKEFILDRLKEERDIQEKGQSKR